MNEHTSQLTSQDKRHKFLVIGNSKCGKSSILSYFCRENNSLRNPGRTIGCDIHIKEFQTKHGEKINEFIEFWELSLDFKRIPIFEAYIQAMTKEDSLKGIIFFFDASHKKTFTDLNKYLESFVSLICTNNDRQIEGDKEIKGIPLFFVGNKSDLIKEESRKKIIQGLGKYVKRTFEDNKTIMCTFLSIKFPYTQFKPLQEFIQACIKEEWEDLFLYKSDKRKHSYGRLSYYTKDKLFTLKKSLQKVIKSYF